MELRFEDEELERLAYDPAFRSKRWHPTLVRATRKRLQQLNDAPDERTIRNIAGAHLEQLHGERAGTSGQVPGSGVAAAFSFSGFRL